MTEESISREEAAWLAAIIEGEGSIHIARHKLSHGKITFRLAICVCNTDCLIIKKVSELWYKLGCKFYYKIHNRQEKYPNSKIALTIECVGRTSTNKILDLIMPHLISKRDQAELAKEFNQKMEEIFYQRIPVDEYIKIQINFVDRLLSMRVQTVNPQRLERTASKPLQF